MSHYNIKRLYCVYISVRNGFLSQGERSVSYCDMNEQSEGDFKYAASSILRERDNRINRALLV